MAFWNESITMVSSIEELKTIATNLRKDGLNSQQIADELSLSQDTIAWLLTGTNTEQRPTDVRIGWRTIGVRPARITAIGNIMADVVIEEFDEAEIVVGISINGIAFAHEVAQALDVEVAIHRNVDGEPGAGALSSKYGQVGGGKKVVIIDDVLSSGVTMSQTIAAIRAAGGEVVLALVLVNKTVRNEIDNVPLRGLIRAVPV
ncbi:MAG: orotate phosphoribosyltransferase-like protein [Euryarchaeota archaeon]|nr:orotate phosphoribosyltransferase-like protein [Euryarchaeota archaeon]MBT5593841.1 orotate phosphoribosyltransferase-like protein [Euryarchaeota archaeon]